MQWAPFEYGLILGAGTADGKLVILTRTKDGQFQKESFNAHSDAINGLSWAPYSNDDKKGPSNQRLVTGGSDNAVRVWEFSKEGEPSMTELGHHKEWVRDVAWSDSSLLASCSEDMTCKVWRSIKNTWQETQIEMQVPLWKVSWSVGSSLLAISGGENQVVVMAEDTTSGQWH